MRLSFLVASRIAFGDGSLFFLTLWCPLFIDDNLKTSCRSLMHWLCKFITAAFTWTHDIKLEIRATNKEATTLLYAMFVYNARREDWIQENDEIVFENFRIRPSTRIRMRIGWKNFHSGERFQNFRDTAGKYAGYVWTQAVFVKNLRFHKFPDTCRRHLIQLAGSVWRIDWLINWLID